jgi:hypothetical protein
MSFKDLNLNKGFSKPKYKEKDTPKLDQKELKNDVNKPSTSPKVRIERQKSKPNLYSKNKIEGSKLSAVSRNKIERPKLSKDQNIKFEQVKPTSKRDSNRKIEAPTGKITINPKNKNFKNQDIQKIKINPQERYRTKPIEIISINM